MGKTKEDSTNNYNRKFLTTCDMTYAVQLIGGRWKLLIMAGLHKRPLRYGELKRNISQISERMLTLQLRELEEDGILKRTVFAEVPPRVEYELTAIGKELVPICLELSNWGTKHRTLALSQLELSTAHDLTLNPVHVDSPVGTLPDATTRDE
ncbi:MAG: Transcriptional regulator, HxlR family [uncultured Cytophagales bacterium]|uniref:Transcriptional regulator, HxlR family n=1 Tax=uncultured Cytophagales bacterium TaxID=158755 RepID=A0A6J4KJM5_9SPHI|nr:MAG: Transcriptional regulator, HxlR family [uncultured Cytophagales bacterium]